MLHFFANHLATTSVGARFATIRGPVQSASYRAGRYVEPNKYNLATSRASKYLEPKRHASKRRDGFLRQIDSNRKKTIARKRLESKKRVSNAGYQLRCTLRINHDLIRIKNMILMRIMN